jgi:hypothetical protein
MTHAMSDRERFAAGVGPEPRAYLVSHDPQTPGGALAGAPRAAASALPPVTRSPRPAQTAEGEQR